MRRPSCRNGAAMVIRNEREGGNLVWRMRLSKVLSCFLVFFICCAASFLNIPRNSRQERKSHLMMSSLSGGAEDNPAFSAIRSLADYHEGEWKGRARSFTVTPDTAAGVVQRKVSAEYTVNVKISTAKRADSTSELETGTVSLSETVSWGEQFSHRSIPLFTPSGIKSSGGAQESDFGDIDVDDVDSSYSLDFTRPTDFPSVLSGLSGKHSIDTKRLNFVVEHCIAAGENRRCRCFLVYGEDESLSRVVISDEKRVKTTIDPSVGKKNDENIDSTQNGLNSNGLLTINDFIEMESDDNQLFERISANVDQTSSTDSTEEVAQDLSPYPISLLEVVNGVWLGDVIIRETPSVSASPTTGRGGKGFGKKSINTPHSTASDSFAVLDSGVQKVAWRWEWNFEDQIRQIVDAGKTLGISMNDFMKKSLVGNVCVDESFSRRKPKDERMVYIDWGQDSVGFLLGPFTVRLPRYVNFDPSTTSSRAAAVTNPFYTEFGIFQDGSSPNVTNINEEGEIYCSKIGRLYNFEGRLKQGCTSFYTYKPFEVDDDDDFDDNYV